MKAFTMVVWPQIMASKNSVIAFANTSSFHLDWGGFLTWSALSENWISLSWFNSKEILQKTSLKVEWKSCDRARSPRAPPAPRLLLPPTKMRSIPKLNFKRQLASVNSSIFKIYPQSEYRIEYTTAWQSIEVIYFFLSLFVSTLPPWGEGGEKKEVLILPGTEGLAGGWLMGEQNKNSTGSSNLSLPKLYPPPPVILCLREIFWV